MMSSGSLHVVACVRTAFLLILLGKYPEGALQDLTQIPWMEEPGRLQSPEAWIQVSISTFPFHSHALEKEMATHSSVLVWRIPETGEPGGLLSMGSHRVGHD